MAKPLIVENVEGLPEWNIGPYPGERQPGLSAMVRLKNEAQWVIPSLDSIAPWCDEIVIALQGKQTDGTDRMVRDWAECQNHAVVYDYPFDSVPNGPGHDKQQIGSVHERAYFYNWCMAKTGYSHVMKWDGDMVAFDWLGRSVRRALEQQPIVRFKGIELVSGLERMNKRKFANQETRVFPARSGLHYVTGPRCEILVGWHDRESTVIEKPAYLHFKWAKPVESATKAWPTDWRRIPHFIELAKRAEPGERYQGEWPSVLKGLAPA